MTFGGPAGPRRIVLTGFMGAGKTTVGALLAARLGWPFIDTDAQIAAEQQQSVADIFAQHGEAHFRALELAAIRSAVEQAPVVIALGGGAVELPEVRALLLPRSTDEPVASAVTIYLAAPLDQLLARCHAAAQSPVRPLLAAEGIEQRFARRLPFYKQAHLMVDTAGLQSEQVVTHILSALFAPIQSETRETPAR